VALESSFAATSPFVPALASSNFSSPLLRMF
jgi:hypothetical protein